jgi:magnesium transporter
LTVAPSQDVAGVLVRLREDHYEAPEYIFVVDGEQRLRGVTTPGALLAADPHTLVGALATGDVTAVAAHLDREHAASLAIQKGTPILAVLDAEGHFLGAVLPTALLSILRDEHLEDLHQMAGILGRSDAARRALSQPPPVRALYRLPWLLVGLVGSIIATAVVQSYESTLQANIVIAFFVPAIVYLADAIGTQSEAVAVRGLSLATPELGQVASGEIGTGALIGLVLAAVAFVLVGIGFGDASLAMAVALAVLAAGTVATAIGSLLPLLFSRLGYDPAHGSGPVGTVIQDVLSLIIYFWIASLLVA